jgi:hypothetical protein
MATLLVLTFALPTMSLAKEGRYQAVQIDNGSVLIIDTRTGVVVKRCFANGKCRDF